MQIIIIHEKIHNETEENAEAFKHFLKLSLKDNDGEVNFRESNIEIETMSDDLFDDKAPDWFN